MIFECIMISMMRADFNNLRYLEDLLCNYQYNIILLKKMSWCCAREKPLKKKVLSPVYEKKKPVSSVGAPKSVLQSTHELKLGSNPLDDDLRKISHQLNSARPEVVQKSSDFTAVYQEFDPTNRFVLKKLQKCGYDEDQLSKKFKETSQKWVDPDFIYEQLKIGSHKGEWLRPEQFIKNPALFPEEITPNDVLQGWLNDCYFLSALSCLAEKPFRIYSLFQSKQYNPNGYYICKLTFNGVYQEVIVDDLFPVVQGRPIYAKPAQKRYIWPMVLQKCWAKLLKGYTMTNDGYTSEAFSALTGAPTKFHLMKAFITPQDPKALRLFQILKQADERQFVTEVSIGVHTSAQQKRDWQMKYGLPTGHAYSLLGVYETKLKNGELAMLLQIRNPWGDLESKLMWNDKDPKWDLVYPQQKQRMQYFLNANNMDGVFYMNWQTFVTKFDYIFSICEINDNSHYTYTDMTVNAGQAKYLQVQTDGNPSDLAISFVQTMEQHFKEDYRYANISVMVSRLGVDANKERTFEFVGAGNFYDQDIENYFTFPLKKFEKGRYIVRVFAYWDQEDKKKEVPLTIGVYSPAVIGLREAKDIKDQDFLERICLSLGRKNPRKQWAVGDPSSWFCSQMLPETNMGYFMFQCGANSPSSGYKLTFNESTNYNLQFFFQYSGKKSFEIDCERGYQYIVLFGYVMDPALIYKKAFYPESKLSFKLPRPQVTNL